MSKIEDLWICESCGYESKDKRCRIVCPKCGGAMRKVVVVR